VLRRAVWGAVRVGGVEKVDPDVERRVHDRPGAVGVQPAAEVVTTEADNRDHEAGTAEPAVPQIAHDPSVCRADGDARATRPGNNRATPHPLSIDPPFSSPDSVRALSSVEARPASGVPHTPFSGRARLEP